MKKILPICLMVISSALANPNEDWQKGPVCPKDTVQFNVYFGPGPTQMLVFKKLGFLGNTICYEQKRRKIHYTFSANKGGSVDNYQATFVITSSVYHAEAKVFLNVLGEYWPDRRNPTEKLVKGMSFQKL